MAVDENDNVYFVDFGNSHVQKFATEVLLPTSSEKRLIDSKYERLSI